VSMEVGHTIMITTAHVGFGCDHGADGCDVVQLPVDT
jgi:hypothetical protein